MGTVRKALVRRTPGRLAISPFTAEVLAQRAGLPLSAFSVIHLPVAHRFAWAARERTSRPVASAWAGLRILTVSRLTRECRYKGHFTVAASIAELAAAGSTPEWTVVGHGDDLPELRRRCGELGIERYVEFCGRVDDEELSRLYHAADVLVLPSAADPDATPPVGEGFGLVYAEAGAYGVPSVACQDGGGSSAFVFDNETGLTVPPDSPTALTETLRRMRNDPALGRRLGEAARERVLARHLPEHFADELAALVGA
jgi:glycosyltransferase involved in cell wall biosynthesis